MTSSSDSWQATKPVARPYYGWYVLVVAAAAMVGTLPGRTQGLGLITEPLLSDLRLDRFTYAEINFWATMAGSAGAFGVGRLIDRYGSRSVLTIVALALGSVVCLMSRATTILSLALLITLTRALGQSALSVVSITMVGQWFVRRIDLAMAVYSIVLSVGFMAAFPVVGALVQQDGWRFAWLMVGLAIAGILAPLAAVVVRRPPEAAEELTIAEKSPDASIADSRWREAVGTSAFWAFAFGAALYGLVASGIGLFNESILSERGFSADIYYRALVITAMTSLVGNFGGGWLAMRVRLPLLLAGSLAMLAAGVAVLPYVATVAHVMAWATAMGLSGGVVMVLFFSAWPRLFGRAHLGQIQGTAQALTVIASAVGPLLLAWGVRVTGSYARMFHILAIVIGATAAAALIVPSPRRKVATP